MTQPVDSSPTFNEIVKNHKPPPTSKSCLHRQRARKQAHNKARQFIVSHYEAFLPNDIVSYGNTFSIKTGGLTTIFVQGLSNCPVDKTHLPTFLAIASGLRHDAIPSLTHDSAGISHLVACKEFLPMIKAALPKLRFEVTPTVLPYLPHAQALMHFPSATNEIHQLLLGDIYRIIQHRLSQRTGTVSLDDVMYGGLLDYLIRQACRFSHPDKLLVPPKKVPAMAAWTAHLHSMAAALKTILKDAITKDLLVPHNTAVRSVAEKAFTNSVNLLSNAFGAPESLTPEYHVLCEREHPFDASIPLESAKESLVVHESKKLRYDVSIDTPMTTHSGDSPYITEDDSSTRSSDHEEPSGGCPDASPRL